jgi:Ca2+-binding EF-hand superfamily protein
VAAPTPPAERPNIAPESPSPADERIARLRSEAEAQFRSADTDGDGYLSRREVRARFPLMARIFDRIDADGDGRISFDEFVRFRIEQVARRTER